MNDDAADIDVPTIVVGSKLRRLGAILTVAAITPLPYSSDGEQFQRILFTDGDTITGTIPGLLHLLLP